MKVAVCEDRRFCFYIIPFGLKKTSRIKAFVFKFSLMEKQTA